VEEGYDCGLLVGSVMSRAHHLLTGDAASNRARFISTAYSNAVFALNEQLPSVGPYNVNCSQGLHAIYLTAFSNGNNQAQLVSTYPLPGCGVDVTGTVKLLPYVFGTTCAPPLARLRAAVSDRVMRVCDGVAGMSAAFSGPNANLGSNLRDGLMAAFRQVNVRGGVDGGRFLQLVAVDDGYTPANATANTRALLQAYPQLTAFIGYVGTPTTSAALPLMRDASGRAIPLIAPFTGARVFRHPFVRNVINLRACTCCVPLVPSSVLSLLPSLLAGSLLSVAGFFCAGAAYDDEVAAMVDYSLSQGRERISLFRQDDGFGAAGQTALEIALANKALSMLVTSHSRRFPRPASCCVCVHLRVPTSSPLVCRCRSGVRHVPTQYCVDLCCI